MDVPDSPTPFYWFRESVFRDRLAAFRAAFAPRPVTVAYAVKANTAPLACPGIVAADLKFEANTPGEVAQLTAAGVDPARIVYTAAAEHRPPPPGVGAWILGSADALRWLETSSAAYVGVRVNPGAVGAHGLLETTGGAVKFGVPPAAALVLARRVVARRGRVGIHVHLGTQIRRPEAFRTALAALEPIIRPLARRGQLAFLDLGGGFPVPYDEPVPPLDAFAAAIREGLAVLPEDVPVWLEPGRWLVAPAEDLVTTVTAVKTTPAGRFVFVDAPSTALLDMALLGQRYPAVRLPGPHQPARRDPRPVTVVGPLCDTLDVFRLVAPDLDRCRPGDRIRIRCVGAYGAAQSNRFNGVDPPPVVIERADGTRVVRTLIGA